jgi:quercetin dioxygenase-like cupin family protein
MFCRNLKYFQVKRMKKASMINTIALISIATLFATSHAFGQQSAVNRALLQRHDLSVSGLEVVQARIHFNTGASFGAHTHPGEEIIYVLEGRLEYTMEGKAPITLKAGDVLFIPTGIVHSAKNVGKTKAVELATYVVKKGKPLITEVK